MREIAEVRISRIRLRRATTALAALAAFGLGVVAMPSAKAQSLSVLYSFTGVPDGEGPLAALIMDKAGNLYGTTFVGGTFAFNCVSFEFFPAGCGTVFKLDSSGSEIVLHSFANSPGDGAIPTAALIMDKAGNLYGTTGHGGASGNCFGGCGTVFKLDTSGNETVLHSFTAGDGAFPLAGLIMDKGGNLYGTTESGGASGDGTVFKLDSSGKLTVLYSFTGTPDGATPQASLIMDKAGNLYGTTANGGAGTCSNGVVNLGCGTVFKLDTSGNETVLHSFMSSPGDGANPVACLIMDKKGNLYGTTNVGGASGVGTVFKLDPSGNETVLHSFTGGDGANPQAGLIMDKAGNLYGTTVFGGVPNCAATCGTVFKLIP
jgi:uncharacterized repeat protein (TIGR03803 family)